MTVLKRVPDEFGIIIPRETGVQWLKQAGGFSCAQHTIEGIFIPLGRLRYRLGRPDWAPDSPNFDDYLKNISPALVEDEDISFPNNVVRQGGFGDPDEFLSWVKSSQFDSGASAISYIYDLESHPDRPTFGSRITDLDLGQIPDRDYETLPDSVKNENSFYSSDQYLQWVADSGRYGYIELWDDAQRFTYGVFENLDDENDPRIRWESEGELWDVIDSRFPFEYSVVEYGKSKDIPVSPPAIQPIHIESVDQANYSTDFSGLEGEVVALLGPNAD